MRVISVPISPGELLDKITILEIKMAQMQDENKLKNVHTELSLLNEVAEKLLSSKKISDLKQELKFVNQELWKIEDDIRDHEKGKDFNDQFIELARSVYIKNDRRAELKKTINIELGSTLIEEKSYQQY
jgi:hypothetical protein